MTTHDKAHEAAEREMHNRMTLAVWNILAQEIGAGCANPVLAGKCVDAVRAELAPSEVPMDEWVDYAKRSGLLDENGVAIDPRQTQTAWFAFTAAWNRRSALTSMQASQADGSKGGAEGRS